MVQLKRFHFLVNFSVSVSFPLFVFTFPFRFSFEAFSVFISVPVNVFIIFPLTDISVSFLVNSLGVVKFLL